MMTDFDPANLVYLVVLGCAVMLWFLAANRHSMGRNLQQAAVWGLIFIGVIAAIGLWDDISRTVAPAQSVSRDGTRIELPRAPDGHYYLDAAVNDAPVRFVIDTGASDIVLSHRDAVNAGLHPEGLAFTGQANTANGLVRTAPVRLDNLTVGGVTDRGLRAVVNEGDMAASLLGMRYLQRFTTVQITGGKLVLER